MVLKSSLTKYYAPPEKEDAVTLVWNHIMAQMSCCGVNNYKDFDESPKWLDRLNRTTVPIACCKLKGDGSLFIPDDPHCPNSPTDYNSYYNKGCYQAIIEWIMSHTDIVIGVAIGVGLIQLLGIFLAFCLCKSLDRYIK